MISILCDDDDDGDEEETAAMIHSRTEDYRTPIALSIHYRTSSVYRIPLTHDVMACRRFEWEREERGGCCRSGAISSRRSIIRDSIGRLLRENEKRSREEKTD